jgi:hypothetical protein
MVGMGTLYQNAMSCGLFSGVRVQCYDGYVADGVNSGLSPSANSVYQVVSDFYSVGGGTFVNASVDGVFC